MLIEKDHFSLARFPTLATVDWAVAAEADMLQINEFVPGGVYHSEHLIWRGDLSDIRTPEEFIKSKRDRKAHHKALEFFAQQGMQVKLLPMTEPLFSEFRELYNDTTMVRERPVRFDLESTVLGKMKVGQSVFLIGLFDAKSKLLSALIFSVYNGKVAVSFGAKRKFPVRGGAGGVFEHELAKYCLEHGYTDVSHGTATNPVGLYTQAGVFEFKARYGYSAHPMGRWCSTFIKNTSVALSDLVFVGMHEGREAYTVITSGDAKEALQKYATHEVASVVVRTPQQVEKEYQKLLKNRK